MAKEYKFQKLLNYLKECDEDTLELTFGEIENILDFELAKSAYQYESYWQSTPTHTITKSWENAGYEIGKLSLFETKLMFTRSTKDQSLISSFNPQKKVTSINGAKVLSNQDVNQIIAGFNKYAEVLTKDPHARYLSWEHCYKSFLYFKGKEIDEYAIDYLALHLGFYLASWGMYRGSSFLLQKDYKVHGEAVAEIYRLEYEPLWAIECQAYHQKENQILLKILYQNLSKIYIKQRNNIDGRQDVSNTLITKILMGTIGCVPAYDRYFRNGIKKFKVASLDFSIDSIMELVLFYENNREVLENCSKEIASKDLVYPQMKILDMCFWQAGYDLENLQV